MKNKMYKLTVVFSIVLSLFLGLSLFGQKNIINNQSNGQIVKTNNVENKLVPGVDSPVLSGKFLVLDGKVTDTSFTFEINAVKDSELQDPSGGIWFDVNRAYLIADSTDESGTTTPNENLDTEYLGKGDEVITIHGEDDEFLTYRFRVNNLNSSTTYSNFKFSYDGTGTNVVDDIAVPGTEVTTYKYKTPFNPTDEPISFDYLSVTDTSFEFTITSISDVDHLDDYSWFSPKNTVLYYYVGKEKKALETNLISEEDNIQKPGYRNYTYEVTGLNPSTEYTNFAIGINDEQFTPLPPVSGDMTFDYYLYDIPYVIIYTHTSRVVSEITSIILAIILLIILLILIAWIIFIVWKRKVSIAIYPDVYWIDLNTPILTLINGRKHKNFWNAPVDQMKLYVSGNEIFGRFFRERDGKGNVTGIVKIVLTDIFNNGRNVYYMLSGLKHNDFEISHDGGETRYPIHSLRTKTLDKQLDELKNWKEEGKTSQAYFMFDERETTSNSIRYTIILPKGDKFESLIEAHGDALTFYHQVDDKMYPIKTKQLGRVNSSYSWDLIGLEPGTAYVNINWSIDNETLIPSTANFGVTRDEEGNTVSLQDSVLTKNPKGNPLPLPSLDAGVAYLGRELIHRQNVVVAQKHFQRDEGYWIDEKLLTQKVKQYLYKWYDDIDVLFYEIDVTQEELSKADKEIIETFSKGDDESGGKFDDHLYNLVDKQIGTLDNEEDKKNK